MQDSSPPHEWTAVFSRNYLVTTGTSFLVMIAYYLLLVISGPYSIETFHVTPSLAGLVAGIMLLGCLLGRFITGRVAKPRRYKLVLFAGIVVYSASIGAYLLAGDLYFLLAVRFMSGVGVGIIGTVTGSMIVYISPPQRLGLAVSIFGASSTVALGLGPFFGIFLKQYLNYQQLFLCCLGFGLLGFLMALTISVPPPTDEKEEAKAPASLFKLDEYIAYAPIPIAFVTLLVSTASGNIQAFLSLHAVETGLTASASTFFLVYAILSGGTRPWMGHLFDRKGENVITYPSICAIAAGLAVLALADSLPMLLLAAVLLGFGVGNYQTTAQVVSVRLTASHRRSQAISTHFIFVDLGIGLGPFLLGKLVPMYGYRGLYLACAVLAVVCLPLYFLVHGRKYKRARASVPTP